MNVRVALATLAFASILVLGTGFALAAAAAAIPQGKSAAADPSGGYQVDPVHSFVLFKIKHLNTSWTFGRFDQISGTFTLNSASPDKSSVTMSIATESVDTGKKERDDHLRSSSFFDAGQFPEITFASKSVKKAGEGKYSLEGELALHGVKKSLTVDLEQVGTSDAPKMGVRAGFFATFSVKRSDFGMKFMPEAVGDDVQLTVSVEGVQTDSSTGGPTEKKGK